MVQEDSEGKSDQRRYSQGAKAVTVTPDRLRQLAEAAPTFALYFKAAAEEIDRLTAERERLRSEITLLRQEIDEVRYKDTAEVDDLAAIGRLAALIHDQTEDAIARDAAMEIQNIVRGVE